MEEEVSQFFVNRIQENNKKFEQINGQIYQLKILLNKIYQFDCYLGMRDSFNNPLSKLRTLH